ncbi:MAG TPA: hypothetical protein VGC14_24335 [Rhizobium sp.]
MGTEFMNKNISTYESVPKTEAGLKEAYRLVVDEVDQLRRAKRLIDQKLEKAEAACDLLRQLLHNSPHRTKEIDGNSKTIRSKRFHKGSQTYEVVTRAKNILLEVGRPLTRSELLDHMTASGDFTVTARDPARFIGRALWEDPNFVHYPKIGYWLIGTELPQGAALISS